MCIIILIILPYLRVAKIQMGNKCRTAMERDSLFRSAKDSGIVALKTGRILNHGCHQAQQHLVAHFPFESDMEL